MKPIRTIALTLPIVLAAVAARAQTAGDDSVPIPLNVKTSAYTIGEAMNGLIAVPALRAVAPPSGMVNSLGVSSLSGANAAFAIYVFDTAPAAGACVDQQSLSLSASDRLKVVAVVSVTLAAQTGTSASWGQAANLALSVKNQDSPAAQNLYLCLVTGTGFTPASTNDLAIKLGVSKN